MNCLIEFFSDNKQKDLRRLAQNQSESYEDALEIYKKLFISYFSLNEKYICQISHFFQTFSSSPTATCVSVSLAAIGRLLS